MCTYTHTNTYPHTHKEKPHQKVVCASHEGCVWGGKQGEEKGGGEGRKKHPPRKVAYASHEFFPLVVHTKKNGRKETKEKDREEKNLLEKLHTLLTKEMCLDSRSLSTKKIKGKGKKGKWGENPVRKAAYAPDGGDVSRECVARRPHKKGGERE